MSRTAIFFSVLLHTCAAACGQAREKQSQTVKTENKMDTSILTNETVRKAIEALQQGDKESWFSCFAQSAVFTDDGRTLDFRSFFDNAFRHKEKFLAIDKVLNDGKDVYGNFYAGQWGTFKVYFKFRQNTEGKIDRLDIGQAR